MKRELNKSKRTMFMKYATIPILLLVMISLSSSIIGVETVETQEPELEIEQINGGIGIETVITNVGDETANGIRWNTTVEGNFVLRGSYICPTIPVISSLAPGESVTVSSWKYDYIFGFGNASITVATSCDEGDTDELTKDAFLFVIYIGVR